MSAEPVHPIPAARAQSLQEHLCARAADLRLPANPEALRREMRSYLVRASDNRLLAMNAHDVFDRLRLSPSPLGPPPEFMGIYGGEKDLKRTGQKLRFVRTDGAWFHFTITVRTGAKRPLALVAYDFELCFPEHASYSTGLPRFVRFDLNQLEHDNESKGLRCHMHPGHDDLIAPAPLMSPLEVLNLFVTGLVLPHHPRKA